MKYYVTQSSEFEEDGLICDAYSLYVGTSKEAAIDIADKTWEEYSFEKKDYTKIEVFEFDIDDEDAQEYDNDEIYHLCSMQYSCGEYKICHTISLSEG